MAYRKDIRCSQSGFAIGKTTEKAPQTPINKVDKTITVLSVILVGILPIYYYRKGDL